MGDIANTKKTATRTISVVQIPAMDTSFYG